LPSSLSHSFCTCTSLKESKETVTQAPPPSDENKKIMARLKTLKRDSGKLEQCMLELQTHKHALETRLSKLLLAHEVGELGLELKTIDEGLADHEEKWLAISEEIEAADD
jgi:ATP-binding cassette, subfamily F, member 3